ncbi:MAG: ATP synthase gamma chain [Candidatus Woesebacteria bacterium GW2011_GWB1_38_5b]|uniref:ATP synthase gamma chain n=1 Tax=Candidatus Woesebacteria bacterium GW2011_GWB1_38_5b TaxID=1618569 RepID=A0A0G0KH53_9BACT|nr:MAG: ATP synthase gamma chain [Candidatus Woesebacteria bacterium GW2011_GWB1_38_5b]
MITKKQIEEEIVRLITMDSVTRSYSQIASIKMKKIRETVLTARDFLEEINEIFIEVLYSYRLEVIKLSKKRKVSKNNNITFLAHNGRSVAVLISANSGLYGDLIARTFDSFIDRVRKTNNEVTIIGQIGLALFQQLEPQRPYTFFELPDSKVDYIKLANIIKHLVEYEEIILYYPKFQNVINQSPSVFTISAGMKLDKLNVKAKREYIFEPNLENILIFFETEIFNSLLEQTVNESQLAKFASRMLSLDKASEKISERLLEIKIDKLRLIHRLNNKKQLHFLSSLSLWSGGTS